MLQEIVVSVAIPKMKGPKLLLVWTAEFPNNGKEASIKRALDGSTYHG